MGYTDKAFTWRYVTQTPQGRNAARVSGLCRVREGFLVFEGSGIGVDSGVIVCLVGCNDKSERVPLFGRERCGIYGTRDHTGL